MLFEGAGFRVKFLHGLGNTISTIAYLVGATGAELAPADLSAIACDGSDGSKDSECDFKRFTQVAAIGVKVKDVTR